MFPGSTEWSCVVPALLFGVIFSPFKRIKKLQVCVDFTDVHFCQIFRVHSSNERGDGITALKLFSYRTPCPSLLPVSFLTLSRHPYLPPLSSILLFPSLCWGCLFSLSLWNHSSGMSVAEWSSVLPSRSVNPLFRCTQQNRKNMACIFSREIWPLAVLLVVFGIYTTVPYLFFYSSENTQILSVFYHVITKYLNSLLPVTQPMSKKYPNVWLSYTFTVSREMLGLI